ncbi:MAG: TatD family hydrolase [Candidatus Nanoarchaeia archaeon]|nr:TatD family hydrolase [Candidatus Haiyanarchaeum thermophilum]MCW1302986.1 TatD family hydrolase [Candidatus Haiyanarchaeum thermophilum]MCW1303664.1 TatD family hydrolase [Candidatus Haiyanarchaeum thermophilum]MCW1306344.1 TatD family hydrolase [Candidatus Haiyanarchaeum thermophilum]MCW1307146.1 TatD family hydrolase [Candidatus Haiyanarchaeum thermophilum]
MIDVHAHLMEPEFDSDRDEVIKACMKELVAVINCSAHWQELVRSLTLSRRFSNFIFTTASIHPIYVPELSEEAEDNFFRLVEENEHEIYGIGETGLDYPVEENVKRRQKDLFLKHIQLAIKLRKPLIVHARNAFKDALEILQQYGVKDVVIHFFTARELLGKVIENGWYISVNTSLLRSKKIRKIVRDMPIENILTETDCPWLDPKGGRNTPLSIKLIVEEIGRIKRMEVKEVDEITTKNAIKLFQLGKKINKLND